MVVGSLVDPSVTWYIKTPGLTNEEKEFIQNFDPVIYHNDLECYYWAFDVKLPSGRWLENMRFEDALTKVYAVVEYPELENIK